MDPAFVHDVLTSARERSASIPQLASSRSPFLLPLAVIGLLYVSYKLFNLVRVLLSLFVLPGKPVRAPHKPTPPSVHGQPQS